MNIVFDLGGVVFDWNPDKIINGLFEDDDIKDRIKKEIFKHPDWLELDRGTIDIKDAIQRGAERTQLPETIISRLLDAVPSSLTPKQDTIKLLHLLKNTANKLYVLSNMHYASINYLEQNHTFWDIFEAKVFSCNIHRIKPEPEIYEYLLNEHQLQADETVFIDDMLENLEAAQKWGIKTIHFLNAEQCHKELKKLKVMT